MGDGKVWAQDLDLDNVADLLRMIADGDLVGIVNEEAGGIVAYVHRSNEVTEVTHRALIGIAIGVNLPW